MTATTPVVLFDKHQIRQRVVELGAEIGRELAGREICVVGMMKSCLVFMADLIREIPLDLSCHTVRASTRQDGGASRIDIVYSAEVPYQGRHILLVDDVIDTGITLSFLLDHIREHQPKTLKVCALIDKMQERKVDVRPDWVAFPLKEPVAGFIVGYGMDFADRYGGLPYIGTIPRPDPPGEGRMISLSAGASETGASGGLEK
jgi:hypoxanthine phosphoribosyltransferase